MRYDSPEDLVHDNIMKMLAIKNCETREFVEILRLSEKVVLDALEDLVAARYVIALDVYGKTHWAMAPEARKGGGKPELKMAPPTDEQIAETLASEDGEMEFSAWLDSIEEMESTATMECNRPMNYEPPKPPSKQKRG